MVATNHHIFLWDHMQMASTEKAHDPYVMRVLGWMCSTCRTWGAEPDVRAREQAIAQHVATLPPDRSIVAMLERLWERIAEETADCAAADPSICGKHAFEEAARLPDGSLFMCGVHGGRLADRIAGAIQEERARMESQYRRLAGEVQKATADAIMRDLMNPPPPSGHVQGCAAGKDATKACICPPGHPRLTPDLDSVARQAHARMQDDDPR